MRDILSVDEFARKAHRRGVIALGELLRQEVDRRNYPGVASMKVLSADLIQILSKGDFRPWPACPLRTASAVRRGVNPFRSG
jgi:hypothetical protein